MDWEEISLPVVTIVTTVALNILNKPANLSGQDILPGFVLDLTEVWSSQY
ncbi:hypothetical protein LC607_11360 [Nostoc sp. CHAB 5824]|nr:hypothetical protein [Nostoc sp. CHAB 5824]